MRGLEVGAALGGAVQLAPRWRLRLGALAGAVALGLPRARSVDPARSTGADWTARAAAAVGIEHRVTPGASLVLELEPGASLRALTLTDPSGRQSELGGFSLGLRLGIMAAAPEAPAAPSTPPTGRSRGRRTARAQ